LRKHHAPQDRDTGVLSSNGRWRIARPYTPGPGIEDGAAELIARWRCLPAFDAESWRAEGLPAGHGIMRHEAVVGRPRLRLSESNGRTATKADKNEHGRRGAAT